MTPICLRTLVHLCCVAAVLFASTARNADAPAKVAVGKRIAVLISTLNNPCFVVLADSAQPNAGLGYELDSIAAVVLGGTSLSGGRGSVGGTVLGCLIIGVLNNGLFLLNVSPFWQQVIKGTAILLAVVVDKMNSRNRDC